MMRTEAEIREKLIEASRELTKCAFDVDAPWDVVVSEHVGTLEWVLGGEDETITAPNYNSRFNMHKNGGVV